MQPVSKKRLYLGLLAACLLLSASIVLYAWLTFFNRDAGLARYPLAAAVILVFVVLVVAGLGFIGIVISLLTSRPFRLPDRLINFTVSLLYPVVLWFGQRLRIAQERIQSSFVEVNNQLVRARRRGRNLAPHRLLILLPHCLQDSDCPHRITANPGNCVRCGGCPVGDLLTMGERIGVHLRIASGGTLAREAVRTLRPAAIVAVACERDLTSGILDCNGLPVLGVINDRPLGPCHNTRINLAEVEKAIRFFV
jgi:hypothetical protein